MFIRPMLSSRGLTVEAIQSLPAMTSGNAPSGYVVTASSVYDNTGDSGASFGTYHAFDQAVITSPSTDGAAAWYSNSQAAPWTIQRQNPVAYMMGDYSVLPRDTAAVPNSWNLQGSNNGTSWTTIDTRTGITWNSGNWVPQRFTIASPGSYLYYRLSINTANGGAASGYVSIAELMFFKLQ